MNIKTGTIALLFASLAFAPAQAENNFDVGFEGFRDNYRERGLTVDTHTDYKAVTAGYRHDFNGFFSSIDGRYSWGRADYKSVSGVLNNTPEIETDLRFTTGISLAMWHGRMMPYVGGGWRWYFDEGKGRVTNLGNLAYDRRISQFYIPIGITYVTESNGWTFAPTIEVDPMVLGKVHNRFAFAGIDENVINTQHGGYGVRGEFMVGQKYKYVNWQAGPFIRYWHISKSSCNPTPTTLLSGTCWVEPNNVRLQVGAAVRVGF